MPKPRAGLPVRLGKEMTSAEHRFLALDVITPNSPKFVGGRVPMQGEEASLHLTCLLGSPCPVVASVQAVLNTLGRLPQLSCSVPISVRLHVLSYHGRPLGGSRAPPLLPFASKVVGQWAGGASGKSWKVLESRGVELGLSVYLLLCFLSSVLAHFS